MGVYLAGSYRSQRRTPRRAMTGQFRRWSARDGRPSPAVVFSEWRDVLAALRSLPLVAAEGGDCIAVRPYDPSAALTSRLPVEVGIGQGASCPQAAAMPPALPGLVRSDPRPAAAQARVAAREAARSS